MEQKGANWRLERGREKHFWPQEPACEGSLGLAKGSLAEASSQAGELAPTSSRAGVISGDRPQVAVVGRRR